MKSLNILSLTQAHDSLPPECFHSFLNHYGINIKPAELSDLKSLVDSIYPLSGDLKVFNDYYVGYKIPQIGKEFDLLRVGTSHIINIELKRISTEEKIKKQLIRNKYYLSFTEKFVIALSYEADSQTLFMLNDKNDIEKISIDHVARLLFSQDLNGNQVLDNMFNPSDYLVSPFNSTKKFLSNQYFLTHQQEEIKDQILKSITSGTPFRFISITGGAGTGKTLLVYDIAKNAIQKQLGTLIIHCGNLNDGQKELRASGWEIIKIKDLSLYSLSNYTLIIIDEVQRIYPSQLNTIITAIMGGNGSCIFAYDKLQTLAKAEELRDIDSKICSLSSIKSYRLSEKIRTNKEIANFIRMLFNRNRKLESTNTSNIEINYFKSLPDAMRFLKSLDSGEWEVLRFTPSQYDNEHHEKYSDTTMKTSHEVIGQEFDNVVITIDSFFAYDHSGALTYQGKAYYYTMKMLFQNVTRARKRLKVVIIDNIELLNRCMEIVK
ncbi:ATP-binding protein [Enterobacter hormaechei]|uniref:ATP-binding protein n=1 Tax=Enterobacter hormaechei TaxID=158836 RepID=UPI0007997410|nr:DNA/RNA helicase domain-containing protein [Enterobacter hormaechei]MCM7976656.1 ATP-binding protein [Enterobacter hormaechei]MCM7995263.1 ATP-binding protein [Enterobacter hormaechei]MCM8009155.1 ATP-binding protein [Enterobacter hormaechei]MCM8013710.1 ATP-binding protein [Enterobacter hormaechei]MCW5039610.1 ATP-binding protein [Enterobacter hormaechei subsp. xiangfangensis]